MLALSLVACRQLTGPVDKQADGFLARGLFIRENGDPIANARVEIRPEGNGPSASLRIDLDADSQGRFECWVPDIPLRVSLNPDYGVDLPGLLEYNVRFREGEVRTFILRGEYYPGVLGPQKFSDLLVGADVMFRYRVPSPNGGTLERSVAADVLEDGLFRIFLPAEGRYSADVHEYKSQSQYGEQFYFNYDWTDSVQVAAGDTIRLSAPVISYQLELRLGGLPVPEQTVECRTSFWDQYDSSYLDVAGNGQDVLFDLVGMEGSTRMSFYSDASGKAGDPRFLTFFLPISPLHEGDRLSFELGEYELRAHVVDPEGQPLRDARVYLSGEHSLNGNTYITVDSDGTAYYRVNPGSFHLGAQLADYVDTDRYFSLSADTQMEVVMQPVSSKE
jgi:hypothetical protein